MSDHPKREKKESSQSSKEIQVPPIPKQTAGAVTGAAIGSVAGPIGAVVGGVVGAVAASAAGRRPIQKSARRVTTASKGALRRGTRKSPARYLEKRVHVQAAILRRQDLSRLLERDHASERHAARARAPSAAAVARKGVRTGVALARCQLSNWRRSALEPRT